MYMSSEISGGVGKRESQTKIKTALAYLHWYSKVPELGHLSLCTPLTPDDPTVPGPTPQGFGHHPSSFQRASTSCLAQLRAMQLEKATDTAFFERRPKVIGSKANRADESSTTLRRWDLAAAAIAAYPPIREHLAMYTHIHETNLCLHFRAEELLVQRVHNWPSDDLLRNVGGLTVGMILWLASFAYGAIHATAWNNHFPTTTEKWLWRSSAVYISFCGGLWIILNYVAQKCRPINAFWEKWMDGGTKWYHDLLIGSSVLICGSAYLLARAFIVIEAFLGIRSLPADAYTTASWSQVFPHF